MTIKVKTDKIELVYTDSDYVKDTWNKRFLPNSIDLIKCVIDRAVDATTKIISEENKIPQ